MRHSPSIAIQRKVQPLCKNTQRQDRKCTYNVKIRRVHETTVVVEKHCYIFLCVCVCVGALARACACARVAFIRKQQYA